MRWSPLHVLEVLEVSLRSEMKTIVSNPKICFVVVVVVVVFFGGDRWEGVRGEGARHRY